ncbi:myosin light chain kinase, smooth muscle-like [Haliotis rubra]|uniref:myosin light chain kinase, smooth muscle-like n=1 Tax=Haliotis rubra TaxID=36100 RepID=UPI001EE5122B|nr:myosin light chain kinase, smooth muscle-like [Haliotis rubra]
MAKVPKLQRPSDFAAMPAPVPEQEQQMFHDQIDMQIEGEQELPSFEKRIALFSEEQQAPPLPTSEIPKKPIQTGKERPSFVAPLKNTEARQGQKVVFEVRVDGRPEPIVKWYREDALIETSPDYEITSSNGVHRLTIHEVFPEDSGKFTCIATNADGTTTTESRLHVEAAPEPMEVTPAPRAPVYAPPPPVTPTKAAPPEVAPKPAQKAPLWQPPPPPVPPANIPPSFVQRLNDVRLVEGTNTKLECRVLGKPFPQVSWKKDGMPVYEGPRHKMINDERTGRCTLLISKSFSDDEGEYTCTATNPAGEVSTTARLLPEGPRFKEVPTDVQPSPVQEMVLAADQAAPRAEKDREFYIPPGNGSWTVEPSRDLLQNLRMNQCPMKEESAKLISKFPHLRDV